MDHFDLISLYLWINVKKEDVCWILASLDPNSSVMRRARRINRRQYFAQGLNYIWHFDTYDKSKPYGISINGCIDGSSSNNLVESGIHKQRPTCHRRLLLCRLWTDLGTENVVVWDVQTFLHRHDIDNRSGALSYIVETSTSNQRIESWWGILRMEGMEYWIHFLEWKIKACLLVTTWTNVLRRVFRTLFLWVWRNPVAYCMWTISH